MKSPSRRVYKTPLGGEAAFVEKLLENLALGKPELEDHLLDLIDRN